MARSAKNDWFNEPAMLRLRAETYEANARTAPGPLLPGLWAQKAKIMRIRAKSIEMARMEDA